MSDRLMFEPCPTCGGIGESHLTAEYGRSIPCSTCEGRGRVVSESVIEEMADAMLDLPYDTLELRNWGEDSVHHPARLLAEAAAWVVLEHMEDNK